MRKVIPQVARVIVAGYVFDHIDQPARSIHVMLADAIAENLHRFNKRGPRWTWALTDPIRVRQTTVDYMRDTYTCYVRYRLIPR